MTAFRTEDPMRRWVAESLELTAEVSVLKVGVSPVIHTDARGADPRSEGMARSSAIPGCRTTDISTVLRLLSSLSWDNERKHLVFNMVITARSILSLYVFLNYRAVCALCTDG